MALTVANSTPEAEDVWGRHRVRIVDVDFDSSYPTGGESFTPADVGLHEIDAVIVTGDTGGYVILYDATNEKLVAYEAGADGDALDEVADTTDLSAVSVVAVVIGL